MARKSEELREVASADGLSRREREIARAYATGLSYRDIADQRYREAQKLKSLPAERLEDMGMTRADADAAFLRDRYNRPADRAKLPITRRA